MCDAKKFCLLTDNIIIDAVSAGQKVPASPARFTENTFAVATPGRTTGRHYWEARMKEKSNCMLGSASGSLMRRQQITPSPEKNC